MWWWWVLVIYLVLSFVAWFIFVKRLDCKLSSFKDVLIVILLFFICLIAMPFVWTYVFIKFLDLVDKHTYTTFTIHALTEENRITLKQLGFKEGIFVSATNFEYDGFRKCIGNVTISVCNNGRISVYGVMGHESKVLLNIIRALPSETSDELEAQDELI